MANEITKCPMCGTKLKMIGGRMTCKECGYYIRGEEETTGSGSAPQTGAAGQTSSSWQPSSSRNTAPRQVPEHNPKIAILVSVGVGAVCVALFALIVLIKNGALQNRRPDAPAKDSAAVGESRSSAQADPEETESSAATRGEVSDYAKLPSSDFFWSVAEYIWDKPCNTITEEEFASLTAIQINREEKTIIYQLDSQEPMSASYETDAGLKLSDLNCFTGLEWISIDDSFQSGDLRGLAHLSGLRSENNLDEMRKIIPHPENITDLGVEDVFLAKNLTGLDSFPNLTYLSVDYAGLEDISALSGFPDLAGLTLTGCDRLTDFSPLMSLTNLEQLSIESDQLKSIDFVRNMPLLTQFSVEGNQISGIDALADCTALEFLYLYLDEAYNVDDYSVIGDLPLLQELVLEMNYGRNGSLPSFENMTDLTGLSVKNAGDLTPLQAATGLNYLSLENCDGNSLESITALQNLSTLYINDFSVYTSSLEPLTRLPNLTVLGIEDTSVFGNVEEIFGIPTLDSLYLDGCQVGLDFDNIPTSETLRVLSLNDLTILLDPTYNNGDKAKLSEHYDMFDRFPNLTALYLESQGIDSIDFVEKLPKLQYLNITDNNVTSLKPLESLSDFDTVWCGRNTILESLPEDSGITVYTTEP